ncbi:MAG TPA: hypothetical protein VMV69_01550 [Pirellulales bacterium]|nr:hypothetical protein [Pirellulales bacterium]
MVRMRLWGCLALACCMAAGCKKGSIKDFIPPDDAARKALTAALDAWKSGKPFGQVDATAPKIEVGESNWQGGKKLTAYEIVGPTSGDDQNKRFTVKITLDGAAPQETVYVVLGKDPLWVFNQIDFQKLSGM